MTRPFPTPPIKPFKRLQVSDGMPINEERWKLAHQEHRQLQSFLYQSLNQPGIVCGLSVCAIAAPQEVAAVHRDQMWVQIQPGLAIDLAGKPIVVQKPVPFQIKTKLKSESAWVYIVARYRDPDELEEQKSSGIVQGMFRIDEKIAPPSAETRDVELCRIRLRADTKAITQPADVFFPGYGNIDLRYRSLAKACPEALVRVAQVDRSDPNSSQNFCNLSYLLESLEVHHPSLRGEDVERVDWAANLQTYDLLYLTGRKKLSLNAIEFEALKNYLHSGGTLLADVPPEATELIESVQSLAAKQLKTSLEPLQPKLNHPLRRKPFLFGALPRVNQQTIQLFSGGGLILTIGNLAGAWGLEERQDLQRTTIDEAQKLGVNILDYARKRRQWSESNTLNSTL